MKSMIKYDYLIERDEQDEIKQYIPNRIPKELPPLVYIEGPNSSGKSTLLNLVALSFYGHKRNDINVNLINKIESLMDPVHQNLYFTLDISTKNELISFSKKAGNQKIIQKSFNINNQKEEMLSYDQIIERFNLIYDIPENPITRLSEMSNNLKLEQVNLLDKASNSIVNFREILNEVRNSKDPEKIISLENEVFTQELISNELKSEINKNEIDLLAVCQYFYTKCYRRESLRLNEIEDRIESINWNETKVKKMHDRSLDKIDSDFVRCKKSLKEDLGKLIDSLGKVKISKNLISEFEKMSFDPILKSNLIPQKYFNVINDTKKELEKFDKSKSSKIISKINAYEELIRVLEKYQDDDIVMPGENRKFYEVLVLLRKEVQIENTNSVNYKAVEDAKDFLKSLNETYQYIDKKLIPSYIKANKENKEKHDGPSKNDLEKLESQKELAKSQMDYNSIKCVEFKVNLTDEIAITEALNNLKRHELYKKISSNSDEENTMLIYEMNKDLDKKRQKYHLLTESISRDKDQLIKMHNMKQHNLHGKGDSIDAIIMKLHRTMILLKNFNIYLESLMHNTISTKYQIDTPERVYFDKVSEYIGKKLGRIRHIDKMFEVTKVDLLSKKIITVEGKEIRFNDMGTGQSQSAYLLSKLNSLDERKVVVLFDEIAMMDKLSLKPIFNRIVELYNSDKLVCAIVVQKSDTLAIKSLEDLL